MNAKFHSATRYIGLHAALAALCCGVTLTTPATADSSYGEPLTKVVNFADLNLSSEAGAKVLYGRLRMGAMQVCSPFTGETAREKSNWRECVDQAIERAVSKINRPVLTAYHVRRTGKDELTAQVAKDQ